MIIEHSFEETPPSTKEGRLKKAAEAWALAAGVGAVLIYFSGFLAVRMYLTVLGLDSDLGIFHDRYLEVGIKFLVFAFSLLITPLTFGALIAATWMALQRRIGWMRSATNWMSSTWRSHPSGRGSTWGALLLAAICAQVGGGCFQVRDLLVHPFDEKSDLFYRMVGGVWEPDLYLGTIFTTTAISVLLLARGWRSKERQDAPHTVLLSISTVSVALALALLPIQYGCLAMDTEFMRLSTRPDGSPICSYQSAWQIWEGEAGTTYAIVTNGKRAIVTVPKEKRTQITAVGADPAHAIYEVPPADPHSLEANWSQTCK